MDHRDHVELIRAGVDGAGLRWLELGAGQGAFTLALADLLGPGADILANDRNGKMLNGTVSAVRRRFPDADITGRAFDFTEGIPYGPFDGVLAANSLHFVANRDPTLRAIRFALGPAGRLIVVEYDVDRSPWVPHPFSFASWRVEAQVAGYTEPVEIGRVPSRFLGAIYAARCQPAVATAR